jgi:transcriptional regulator with XRE-family HTH domain
MRFLTSSRLAPIATSESIADRFKNIIAYFWRVRYKARMAQELTTSQLAERLGIGQSTARLWCKQGLFPNAHSVETPRGVVWMIPESDLENFIPPKRGRRPAVIHEPRERAA